jgi:hypothetical protein
MGKLTFSMVMNHTNSVFDTIRAIAPPGKDTSKISSRWAFLVTYEELTDIVDDMMSIPDFAAAISTQEALDLKAGKAALNLPNGMKLLPELITEPERLDG